MTLLQLGNLFGGLGLFLLGMRLMTDGLKVAAGPALRHVLAQWTKTPLRGLFSGALITSLVQSSSAVTVATIGFVNAGLLSLLQTIYVIYGSNIGTTMTGWLVALVGFNVDIKVLALPLIGFGMLLRLLFKDRRGALGEALAGFGLFFLGIDVLKTTFSGVGDSINFASWHTDVLGTVLFVGIGFVLTLLMQSSSAAMALTLTAAAGGIIPLTAAAAVVIGANVGTTSTAALAAIGATPNAQRVAAAHVVFNFITGVAALLLLKPFLTTVGWMESVLELVPSAATTLALFHTLFNILGVALLWLFTPRLVQWLSKRFVSTEEDEGRPRYLDRNVISTPALALNAVVLELGRIGSIARGMAKAVLSTEHHATQRLPIEQRVIARLAELLRRYSVEMQRAHLADDISDALPEGLRVLRYYEEVAEATATIAELQQQLAYVENATLAQQIAEFRSEVVSVLDDSDPFGENLDVELLERCLGQAEQHYQELKAALLRAGAAEQIKLPEMVSQLEQHTHIRRLLEQAVKGAQRMLPLLQLAERYRNDEVTPLISSSEQ